MGGGGGSELVRKTGEKKVHVLMIWSASNREKEMGQQCPVDVTARSLAGIRVRVVFEFSGWPPPVQVFE